MKEWKLRSKIYHTLFTKYDDDLSKEVIVHQYDKQEIIDKAILYPTVQTKELYYPAKSYAVAITWALLLEKEFGEDIYESLNDKDLLYENDPYFVTYDNDSETYDSIIEKFPMEVVYDITSGCKNFINTKNYFYKEMLLHETTKEYFS